MKIAIRWRILTATLLGSGIALLAAVLFLFDPQQHGFYPKCRLHELTGWNCAGCGSLRAAHALLHGELLTAIHCNVLFVTALIGVVAWFGVRFWRKDSPRTTAWLPMSPLSAVWLLLGVTVVFSIARNLPFAAFAWLNP